MMLVANQSPKIIGTTENLFVWVQMNEIVPSASSKSIDGTTTSRVLNVPTLTKQ